MSFQKKIVAFKNKAFFLNGSGPQMKANTCYNTGWLLLWLRFYDLFVKYLIGTALNVPFQIGRKGGSVIFFRFAVVAVSIECLWKLNPWLWSSISDRTEC